jgi:hypothetical protein
VTATILAGAFVGIFGLAGAWFLTARFPSARFLRAGYVLMAGGGWLFVAWGVWKLVAIGLAAAIVLAAGACIGAYGTLRRELRLGR